jgi:hypothetical protein
MPPSSRSRPSCSRPPTRGRWGTRSRGRGRRRSPDSEGTSRIRMARAAAPSPSSCNSAELPIAFGASSWSVCHRVAVSSTPSIFLEARTKRLFQNPILASAGCTAALLRRSDLSYSPHNVRRPPSCIAAVRSPSGRRSGSETASKADSSPAVSHRSPRPPANDPIPHPGYGATGCRPSAEEVGQEVVDLAIDHPELAVSGVGHPDRFHRAGPATPEAQPSASGVASGCGPAGS